MKIFGKKSGLVSGWVDILVSIIFAIIGIFMITKTDVAMNIISYILQGIFISIGIMKSIDYFLSKEKYDFPGRDLVYVAIIIGLVAIFCSGLMESMFRIIIACWIIYSGLVRLTMSLKLHTVQINMWKVSLLLSIVIIVGGIYILFKRGALVQTIGIIMLVYSISDLIESIIFVKNVDKLL